MNNVKLNILGTMLLPIENGATADENSPLCALVTEEFKKWLSSEQDLHSDIIPSVGSTMLIPAETWIQAYHDNCPVPLLAEHSHERALYWLPIDMFTISRNNAEHAANGEDLWEIS